MPTANADQWLVTNPESVPTFSAVGYYFGRELQPWLGIPVGLINSNVGGTDAAALDSKEVLAANEELKVCTTRQSSDLSGRDDGPLHQVPDSRRPLVSG